MTVVAVGIHGVEKTKLAKEELGVVALSDRRVEGRIVPEKTQNYIFKKMKKTLRITKRQFRILQIESAGRS